MASPQALDHLATGPLDHFFLPLQSPTMCGRYTLTRDAKTLAEQFRATIGVKLAPRYNITPSQPVPIIRVRKDNGTRHLNLVRWGLIPQWAKDLSIGSRLINARSETVTEKAAFKHAFKYRRCLIPVDGFYEWSLTNNKIPHYIYMTNQKPFAFAGLWERYQDAHGNELDTCTILTTTANVKIAHLHHRMPVILPEEDHERWLDPANQTGHGLPTLLRSYPAEQIDYHPVSSHVNNPKNDDATCIAREATSLFDL